MDEKTKTENLLTANRVDEIFMDCLFKDEEPTEVHIVGEGIMVKSGFHPARLESHKEEIGKLLLELPDEFHSDKGGGMSFLNACMDRHENHWGEHRSMDQLLTLGTATGLAKILVPREMWGMFPGGMPYFVVSAGEPTKTNQQEEQNGGGRTDG